MGHYSRKPYKKHTHDPFNDIDIKREYFDALNEDEDPFDNQFTYESEETRFIDEPDIVRQLRQEELEGTLPLYLLDLSEEVMTTMTNTPNLDGNHIGVKTIGSPRSYQECYELAKKTLKTLSSEHDDIIQFDS